ncbi:unnamed protein product [Pylaiella littoralis]
MAAKVAGSSPQAYAPSTILRWLRDFRKEGGFRRDARGAHEPDWIMSEEDLKSALLAWMISQPRLTIKDVCKYINREIALREVVIRSKEFIEKMRKIQKAHRNILDMETSFLGDQ